MDIFDLASEQLKRKAVTLTVVLDAFEVIFPVPVVAKNVLPLIASNHDVIKGSGKLDSWLSRHALHILQPLPQSTDSDRNYL